MNRRIEVGILGATGMVGQHFVKFLQNHPWFDLTWLGASDRSSGKKYRDATSWRLDGVMPASVADRLVEDSTPGNAPKLLFSAMDASVATEIERAFAEAGHAGRHHAVQPPRGSLAILLAGRAVARPDPGQVEPRVVL